MPWLAAIIPLAYGAVLLLAPSGHGVLAYDELVATRVVATPPMMPNPAYLQPVTDPVFGTNFTQITDPGRPMPAGVPCGSAYCTHRYSSSQAWNADQSLLMIVNGCNGFCFLDGHTFEPLFQQHGPDQCEWHPAHPALMICVDGNTISTWAPRTDAKTILYASDEHKNFEFGPYKGNPSNDGNRLVVHATWSSNWGQAGGPVADYVARMSWPGPAPRI